MSYSVMIYHHIIAYLKRRCQNYEDDISAEKEIKVNGSWFQS